jgi:hypothetical protein
MLQNMQLLRYTSTMTFLDAPALLTVEFSAAMVCWGVLSDVSLTTLVLLASRALLALLATFFGADLATFFGADLATFFGADLATRFGFSVGADAVLLRRFSEPEVGAKALLGISFWQNTLFPSPNIKTCLRANR